MSQADVMTRDSSGTPLRWRDPAGVMHATEGACATPGAPKTFAMRTRCNSTKVALADTWAGPETLTCRSCAALEHEDRPKRTHANSSIAARP